MSEENESWDIEDLLADVKVPPRGHVAWSSCTWERPHETVYIVQVASLDDSRDLAAILTTVLISVIKDAEAEGIAFDDLVVGVEHLDLEITADVGPAAVIVDAERAGGVLSFLVNTLPTTAVPASSEAKPSLRSVARPTPPWIGKTSWWSGEPV